MMSIFSHNACRPRPSHEDRILLVDDTVGDGLVEHVEGGLLERTVEGVAADAQVGREHMMADAEIRRYRECRKPDEQPRDDPRIHEAPSLLPGASPRRNSGS